MHVKLKLIVYILYIIFILNNLFYLKVTLQIWIRKHDMYHLNCVFLAFET